MGCLTKAEELLHNIPLIDGIFHCSRGVFIPKQQFAEFLKHSRSHIEILGKKSPARVVALKKYLKLLEDAQEHYFYNDEECHVGKIILGVDQHSLPQVQWKSGQVRSTYHTILAEDPFLQPYKEIITIYPEQFQTAVALFRLPESQVVVSSHSFARFFVRYGKNRFRNLDGNRKVKREYLMRLHAMLSWSVRANRTGPNSHQSKYEDEDSIYRIFDNCAFVFTKVHHYGKFMLKTCIVKNDIYSEFTPLVNGKGERIKEWNVKLSRAN